MSLKNAVKVSNLTKYYGSLLAVNNISFNVKQGEIFGFLGPNGAGKTTTINMLTSMLKPSSGTAELLGYDILQHATKIKNLIGVVPDESFLYKEMSAWDNIIFSAKLHNVSKTQRQHLAKKFLKDFDLFERRNSRIETFSKGMKKRVMLSTALIHEPRILFLDEPTTGLDVKSSRQIRQIIKELSSKGTTIFLTTHYIEEADILCDRIAIIKDGEIVIVESPEKLKRLTRGEQIIEISFDRFNEQIHKKLEGISSEMEVVMIDNKFRLFVQDPSLILNDVFNFARKSQLTITSINTLQPTLEDAFVKLTGLQTKDMTVEKRKGSHL
ncbi:MAG: ABC transporter ATP-binding protein [Promethearchaeati archaeon]